MSVNYLKIGYILLSYCFGYQTSFASRLSVEEVRSLYDTIVPPPIPPPITTIECGYLIKEFPRFPGCEAAPNKYQRTQCSQERILAYIRKELQYPTQAILNKTEGVVVIRFLITKQGRIKNPIIVRDLKDGCGQEALRIVKSMNTNNIIWIPGTQGGQPIKGHFNLPIRFSLDDF